MRAALGILVFQGLRVDKSPNEVVLENLRGNVRILQVCVVSTNLSLIPVLEYFFDFNSSKYNK